MTEEEWKKAKETFPWRHHVIQNGLGGHIMVLDRMGVEVPLFTLVGVAERLTAHIATNTAKTEGA